MNSSIKTIHTTTQMMELKELNNSRGLRGFKKTLKRSRANGDRQAGRIEIAEDLELMAELKEVA